MKQSDNMANLQMTPLFEKDKERSPQKINNFINSHSQNSYSEYFLEIKKIGPYVLVHQITHNAQRVSKQPFNDFLCTKLHPDLINHSLSIKSTTNHKKIRHNERDESFSADNPKKSMLLLCRIRQQSLESQLNYAFSRINIERIHDQQIQRFCSNIIFPLPSAQIILHRNKLYMPICLQNNSLFPKDSAFSFVPISKLSQNLKIQSELFCLNVLYKFLLNVGKPLFKLIETIYQPKEKTLLQKLLVEHILVRENILMCEKSNLFFLLFLPNRFNSSSEIQSPQVISKSDSQSLQCINRMILKSIAQIFWDVFYKESIQSLSERKKNHLHSSFLKNFFLSFYQGQLSIDEAIEILQSKQKRKEFVNQKILSSDKKQKIVHQKHSSSRSKVKNMKIQTDSQQNHFHIQAIKQGNGIRISKPEKPNLPSRKSVHRHFTGKRNTIDSSFNNFIKGRNVPPSFNSRSKGKKSKLFRHSTLHTQREKQKSLNSNFERNSDQNYSTLGPTIHNSPQKKNLNENLVFNLVNKTANFSFMKNSASNKIKEKIVSKTLNVGQINDKIIENIPLFNKRTYKSNNRYSNNLNQQSLEGLKNFTKMISNENIFQKSQTNNIASYLEGGKKKSPVRQNAFMTVQSSLNSSAHQSYMMSKSKNRRYYHLIDSRKASNHSSISELLNNQKKIVQKTIQNSRSRQIQLLNRSQQNALALFNRQFRKQKQQQRDNQQDDEQNNPKGKTVDISQLLAASQKKNGENQNQKLKSLLKSVRNNQHRSDEEQEYKAKQRKNAKNTYESRQYRTKSKELIFTFSPPKQKTSIRLANNRGLADGIVDDLKSNDRTLNGQKMHSRQDQTNIDDKDFRNRFNTIVVSNQIKSNRNSIVLQTQKSKKNQKSSVQLIPILSRQHHEQSSLMKQIHSHRNKIQNQFASILENNENGQNDRENESQSDKSELRKIPKTQKTLRMQNKTRLLDKVFQDRSNDHDTSNQKTQINPKIQNINKNGGDSIQDENQQMIEQRFRGAQQQNSSYQKKSEQSEDHHFNNQNAREQQIQKRHLSALTSLISPIKKTIIDQKIQTIKQQKAEQNTNTQVRHKQISKQQAPQTIQQAYAKISEVKVQQRAFQKPKFNFKPKNNPDLGQADQMSMSPFGSDAEIRRNKLDSDDLIDIINKLQEPQQVSLNRQDSKFKKKQSDKIIQAQPQLKKRKPSIDLNKKNSTQNKEKKAVSFVAERVEQNNKQISRDKDFKSQYSTPQAPQSKQKENIPFSMPPQQSIDESDKLQIKAPKKTEKIQSEEDLQLQEIKLVPTTNATNLKTKQNISLANTPSDNDSHNIVSSKTTGKPPLPYSNNQSSTPSKLSSHEDTSKEVQRQPASSRHKRQHTGQSSVASSYGPNKSAKKIVEEYIFAVNKIGQAVAKTPKVSKDLQRVVEWYIGVYFLYKRFLYERKRIQKWLKDGTPKLTRYQSEQINAEDWNIYLKSQQRELLIIKVSQQNINIAKSIQKMQKKLLARNIPESIKQHAAISQRSHKESQIAIDGVIDEFDVLREKGLTKCEDIQTHCIQMLNACMIVAELDGLIDQIVPIGQLTKIKRSPEEMEQMAQDLYDMYHDQ